MSKEIWQSNSKNIESEAYPVSSYGFDWVQHSPTGEVSADLKGFVHSVDCYEQNEVNYQNQINQQVGFVITPEDIDKGRVMIDNKTPLPTSTTNLKNANALDIYNIGKKAQVENAVNNDLVKAIAKKQAEIKQLQAQQQAQQQQVKEINK